MNKREIGSGMEHLVSEKMQRMGMVILEMNYACRQGEVDIIARDGEYYVFTEVKYRKDEAFGTPLEAVDRRKQRKICRAAVYYLYSRHLPVETVPIRFDVAGVTGENMNYIKNAFEYIS